MFLSSPIVRYGMIFVYMKKESPVYRWTLLQVTNYS